MNGCTFNTENCTHAYTHSSVYLKAFSMACDSLARKRVLFLTMARMVWGLAGILGAFGSFPHTCLSCPPHVLPCGRLLKPHSSRPPVRTLLPLSICTRACCPTYHLWRWLLGDRTTPCFCMCLDTFFLSHSLHVVTKGKACSSCRV